MKIKILLAAAVLLFLSGCKENIDESGFINGTESLADTEFSLTTFNTSSDTAAETTVPKKSETENLSGHENENTSLAEASQSVPKETEAAVKTTSVTSETEIISLAPSETTAEKTTPTETSAAASNDYTFLDNSANICLAKLSFGMSAEEAAAAINAEFDTQAGDTEFYSNVSFDLDESFCEGYIVYGDGIDQIVMNTSFMAEDKALELEKNLMKKLNKIYRLSDNNWDVSSRGTDVCLVNGIITLELAVNKAGKNALVALTVTSPKHMGNTDTEDISVFPPN